MYYHHNGINDRQLLLSIRKGCDLNSLFFQPISTTENFIWGEQHHFRIEYFNDQIILIYIDHQLVDSFIDIVSNNGGAFSTCSQNGQQQNVVIKKWHASGPSKVDYEFQLGNIVYEEKNQELSKTDRGLPFHSPNQVLVIPSAKRDNTILTDHLTRFDSFELTFEIKPLSLTTHTTGKSNILYVTDPDNSNAYYPSVLLQANGQTNGFDVLEIYTSDCSGTHDSSTDRFYYQLSWNIGQTYLFKFTYDRLTKIGRLYIDNLLVHSEDNLFINYCPDYQKSGAVVYQGYAAGTSMGFSANVELANVKYAMFKETVFPNQILVQHNQVQDHNDRSFGEVAQLFENYHLKFDMEVNPIDSTYSGKRQSIVRIGPQLDPELGYPSVYFDSTSYVSNVYILTVKFATNCYGVSSSDQITYNLPVSLSNTATYSVKIEYILNYIRLYIDETLVSEKRTFLANQFMCYINNLNNQYNVLKLGDHFKNDNIVNQAR